MHGARLRLREVMLPLVRVIDAGGARRDSECMADPDYIWKLRYAGEEFALEESDGDPLDDYDGKAGTLKLNLGHDKWLTITVGPGIPIAVTKTPRPPQTLA